VVVSADGRKSMTRYIYNLEKVGESHSFTRRVKLG
jgi:hypothetical protein